MAKFIPMSFFRCRESLHWDYKLSLKIELKLSSNHSLMLYMSYLFKPYIMARVLLPSAK